MSERSYHYFRYISLLAGQAPITSVTHRTQNALYTLWPLSDKRELHKYNTWNYKKVSRRGSYVLVYISRCAAFLVLIKCLRCRCHYTKSNPIDDHSNISSKRLQKQNFKPLGHYTCMQCGTSHLQTIQENILSHIILATYKKFTVATVRFTQNVSCNIYIHPIYQQVANVTV